MLPNEGLLIGGTFVLAISSAGFFFAQFSRSTRRVQRTVPACGLIFLFGVGAVVAALVI
jgi:hypothetical protein